jgi:hypothetical protein
MTSGEREHIDSLVNEVEDLRGACKDLQDENERLKKLLKLVTDADVPFEDFRAAMEDVDKVLA